MQTIENPPVPFAYPLGPFGLQPDAELNVHGETFKHHHDHHDSHHGFAIEFRAGSMGQDIALHVNFRFKTFEHTVVVNTCSGGHWQKEERHHNRLKLGDGFRVKIVNHEKHFVIEVNEHPLCHFHHRIPYQSITSLDITGDAHVHRVHMLNMGGSHHHHSQPGFNPNMMGGQTTVYQSAPPAYSAYESPMVNTSPMPPMIQPMVQPMPPQFGGGSTYSTTYVQQPVPQVVEVRYVGNTFSSPYPSLHHHEDHHDHHHHGHHGHHGGHHGHHW